MYATKSSLFSECITQSSVFTQISLTLKLAPLWRIRDSRILFTNQYASSIEVSRPKIRFSNVCSDIIICSQNWDMYHGNSTFFKITHWFSSLISPRIGFLALKWRRHQGVRSPPNPLSDRRKSLPHDPDIAPHSLRYTHLASPWLAERFISHFQVAQYPISAILGENSVYLESTLPHVGDQNA